MTVKRKHRCDDMCWKLQDTCRFEQGVFSLFLPSELSSLWADCTIQWKFMLIQTGSQPSHLLASIIKNEHQPAHHHHNKSIKECLVKWNQRNFGPVEWFWWCWYVHRNGVAVQFCPGPSWLVMSSQTDLIFYSFYISMHFVSLLLFVTFKYGNKFCRTY